MWIKESKSKKYINKTEEKTREEMMPGHNICLGLWNTDKGCLSMQSYLNKEFFKIILNPSFEGEE